MTSIPAPDTPLPSSNSTGSECDKPTLKIQSLQRQNRCCHLPCLWAMVGLIIFITGCTYLLCIPFQGLVAQKLYVDENALVPGVARSGIDPSIDAVVADIDAQLQHAAGGVLQEYSGCSGTAQCLDIANMLDDAYTNSRLERETHIAADVQRIRNSVQDAIASEIETIMMRANAETTRRVYTSPTVPSISLLHYGRHHIVSSVMNTPRASQLESIALVLPYDSSVILRKRYNHTLSSYNTFSGLSLGLAMLHQLSTSRWLGKSLLIVAVDEGFAATKQSSYSAFGRWMNEYIHDTPECDQVGRKSSNKFVRAGLIRTALALDVRGDLPLKLVSMCAGGHHGLLPNLDIVSVTAQLLRGWQIGLVTCGAILEDVSVSGHVSALLENTPLDSYDTSFLPFNVPLHRGLLRSVAHLATGFPSGYHAQFLDHNVDALTIRQVSEPPYGQGNVAAINPLRLGSAIESIVRSWNNLIEKLHHSTYFFLLLSNTEFTTMEKYFPAFVLLFAPVPLAGFVLLLPNEGASRQSSPSPRAQHICSGSTVLLLPILLFGGLTLAAVPIGIGSFVPVSLLSTEFIMAAVALTFATSALLIWAVVHKSSWQDHNAFAGQIGVSLLMSACTMVPCAIINYSLAVVGQLVLTPLLMLSASNSIASNILHSILVIVLSPIGLLNLVSFAIDVPNTTLLHFIGSGLFGVAHSSVSSHTVLSSVLQTPHSDDMLLYSWICLVYIPAFTLSALALIWKLCLCSKQMKLSAKKSHLD
jgi:Gaa1-like, GPI transamidase component